MVNASEQWVFSGTEAVVIEMEKEEFERVYDCQINFQYSYIGGKKLYYPIISNFYVKDREVSLQLFDAYPIITFHSSNLEGVTLTTSRIRDLNFQDCQVQALSLDFSSFGGTLGFANSTIALHQLSVTASPKIIAIVECVVLGLKSPDINGINIHTLAILSSSLDYLDLNPLLERIELEQLMLTDIESHIPLTFDISSKLKSIKLKQLALHSLHYFQPGFQLKELHLDHVDLQSYLEQLSTLEHLSQLVSLQICYTPIHYLPDLNLPHLEHLKLDRSIRLDDKLQARLKLAGIRVEIAD